MASRLVTAIISALNAALNAHSFGTPIPSGDPNGTLGSIFDTVMPDAIQPLSGAPSGNVVYSSIPTGPAIYRIYIPATYLVASSGGPYTLTLGTGSGTTVVVPIAANGNTILSGALLFNVYVDASGNVIGDAWKIAGSNSNGSYEQSSNGEMIARTLVSANLGAITYGPYFSSGPFTFTYPVPFISAPVTEALPIQTGQGTFGVVVTSLTATATSVWTLKYFGAAESTTIWFFSTGRWR